MVLWRANVDRDDIRWLGLRSHLDLIFFGYGGIDNKMDFVDVVLCVYGCMYAVSPRPWLTLWWVTYVCLLYPLVLIQAFK